MCVGVLVCVYRWNQLDLAIVVLSVAGIVLEEMDAGFIPINPTIIRVMRVLRIARGMRHICCLSSGFVSFGDVVFKTKVLVLISEKILFTSLVFITSIKRKKTYITA